MGAIPESMMSNSGVTPWHRVGHVIDRFCTGAEALVLGGLDWAVRKGVVIDGDTFEAVPNRYVLKADRPDGESFTIGDTKPEIVSDTYETLQNSELGDVVDTLGVNVQTAGAMWDGRFAWMLADLGASPRFDGTGEDIHRWLLVSTWHGSGAFRIEGVNVRVVCENTLRLAQSQGELFHSIRHTSNAQAYLDAAKQALHDTYVGFDEWDAAAERLLNEPFTTTDMRRELVPAVFGKFPTGADVTERKQKAAAQVRADLRAIWDGPTIGGQTKWHALQAVNEYELWKGGRTKTADARSKRQIRQWVNGDFPLTRKAERVLVGA